MLPGMPAPTWERDEAPTSDSDEFYTPAWVLAMLPPIDLDPCSPPHRPVPARRHYVLSEGQDGLALPWDARVVYCNPPYSRGSLPAWCAKARSEVDSGRAGMVIGLIPARPGSSYWHADIWGRAEVGFFKGRIAFDTCAGAGMETGTFDSALVVWTKRQDWAGIIGTRTQGKIHWCS